MNRVFIRDIEEIRDFVKLHHSNEEYFDKVVQRLMRIPRNSREIPMVVENRRFST